MHTSFVFRRNRMAHDFFKAIPINLRQGFLSLGNCFIDSFPVEGIVKKSTRFQIKPFDSDRSLYMHVISGKGKVKIKGNGGD